MGALSAFMEFGGQQQSFNYNREIQRFVNDLSERQLKDNQGTALKAHKRNSKVIDTAENKAIGSAKDLRGRSKVTAKTARGRNLGIFGIRERQGIADLARDKRDTVSRAGSDMRTGLADVDKTRDENLGTAQDARRASLRYFNPAIRTGKNALGAYSDMLGLSRGGYNMKTTAATKYLLNQGRNTVEGGAAGAGGLYSGETLAELEKMRHGLVAQDYGTQMDQLGNLITIGQGAGANAATVQGQYRDAASGYRDDATKARIGLRDNATGRITDARNLETEGTNALRGYYGSQMAKVNDLYANRVNEADVNYSNQYTGATDTAAARGLDNNNNFATTAIQNRNNRINQYLGGSSMTLPGITQSLQNSGKALANGVVGAYNAYGQTQANNAYNQGQNDPSGTWTPPQQNPWLAALY
jgi:hypothetical protein